MSRKVKENNILISCNKNAKFYTLPKLAEFNEFDLWNHSGIIFSKNGNLSKTIIHFINSSSCGYTSKELEKILHIRVFDQLRILSQKNKIRKVVKEHRRYCIKCNKVFYSKELEMIVKKGNNYAYDFIVEIGKLRYFEKKQTSVKQPFLPNSKRK